MRNKCDYSNIFHIEKVDDEDKYQIFLKNAPTNYYITYSGQIFHNNKELCKYRKENANHYKITNINGEQIHLHKLIFICFGKYLQDEKYRKFMENNIKNVTIDHIDNKKNNNSYDNLQAISNQENIKKNPPKNKRNVDYSFKNEEEFKEFLKNNKNIKHITYNQKIKNVKCVFNNIYIDLSTRKVYILYRRKIQIKLYVPSVRFDKMINIYDTTNKQKRINYTKCCERIFKYIDKKYTQK